MLKSASKITTLRLFLIAIVVGLAASWSAPARAQRDADRTTIPDSVAGIWASIDNETAEITKAIQTGGLSGLHHHAFAIRDLVAALPAHSSSLPTDSLAKVKANEKFVATLAQRLDAAGDANDKAESESNFQKLKNILKTIRSLYPNTVVK